MGVYIMEELKNHLFTLENQKRIAVTCVLEVEIVTQEKIVLALNGGKRLTVNGRDLKMGAFSKQTGNFSAEGFIYEVKYGAQKNSFIKRLLK